jgi:hypothetical protein
MYGELIAAELADLFGVSVPASTGRVVRDSSGQFQHVELVTRWKDGGTLSGKTAAEVIAVKDQMIDHRVFSMLIGDYDRKIDNYVLDSHGRLWGVDAGQARFFKRDIPSNLLVQHCHDHWLVRSRAFIDQEPWMRSQLLLEQSLTKKDMLPAIQRAKRIMGDRQKLAEIERRIRKTLSQVIDDPVELERHVSKALNTMQEQCSALDLLKFDGDGNLIRNNLQSNAGSGVIQQQTLVRIDASLRRAA